LSQKFFSSAKYKYTAAMDGYLPRTLCTCLSQV
jgi:hypothetical protein